MKSVFVISLIAGSLAVPAPLVPAPLIPTPFGGCNARTQCFLPSPAFATGNCINSCINEGTFCTPACQTGYVPSMTSPINCIPDSIVTRTVTPVVPTAPLPPSLSNPFLDGTFTCVRGCTVVCEGANCPLTSTGSRPPSSAPYSLTSPIFNVPYFNNNNNLGVYPITVAQGDRLFCADGHKLQYRNSNGKWTSDGVQKENGNRYITCNAANPDILYRCHGGSSKKGLLGLLGLLGIIPLCLLCLLCFALLGCCKKGTRTGGDVMISTFDPVPQAHVHHQVTTIDPVGPACATAGAPGPYVGHF